MESFPSVQIGDYTVLYEIGFGATGKVVLAEHVSTGVRYAIKIIKKSLFRKTPDLEKKVHREIALMRLFDHPHLLKLIEVSESPHHLYIVMDHAEHGELFDLLAASKFLPVELAMPIFRQIIYGLEFLHSHAICHRDIKPENILLDQFNDVKIGDFGFARWMKRNVADTSCGSPHYAAPEVVRGVPYDGRAADIWSCGVVLFALLAGRLPFNDPAIRNLLAKVKSGKYVMPDFPPAIQNLVSLMLTVDPSQRITIADIKAHEAFRIGLVSPAYALPTPLPLPLMVDPIDPRVLDAGTVAVLRGIGFASDEEIAEEFAMVGASMGKVFYSMLCARSPESYPWEAEGSAVSPLAEAFLESPEVGFANPAVDSFGRGKVRRGPGSIPGSPYSLAERAPWADVSSSIAGEMKADVVQPCVGIVMPLDALLFKMQGMLTAIGFQWFHPDDFTIAARAGDRQTYLVVKVSRESPESLRMDLFFTQTTHALVHYVLESTRMALTSE
jgi:BR serine/threonine kinase